MPISSVRVAAAAFALMVLAVSCASGSSSAGLSANATTGDATVDTMLGRIDAVSKVSFTATYSLTRKLGDATADARVSQAPPRLSIVIRDVKFIAGDLERTCDLRTSQCVSGVLAQRVADVTAGLGFYGPTAATQIRVTMSRRSGAVTTGNRRIAGRDATCVGIDVGGGTETYCALSNGVVALIDRADVLVELTSYQDAPDAPTLALPS